LPDRDQYLDFIRTYSVKQAGEVQTLAFRVPEFSTVADHVGLGDFGAATFLNNEHISAEREDALSYCAPEEPQLFVFRSAGINEANCRNFGFPREVCDLAEFGLAPLDWLPDWHNLFRGTDYDLGIFWEFPYLLRMDYELSAAGSVTAFGFSVPFGVAENGQSYYGSQVWTKEEFSLEEILTQCTRFCDHPTFDSAGVYHVTDPFRTTYARDCYVPNFPAPGDSGFPFDP
jgi:hypothetical protein